MAGTQCFNRGDWHSTATGCAELCNELHNTQSSELFIIYLLYDKKYKSWQSCLLDGLNGKHNVLWTCKVKVKLWEYRPGHDPRISRPSAHEGGKVVSTTHRLPLLPRKYSWFSFLLESESTPGSLCDRKDYVNEKFQWHNRESSPWPSGL